MVDPAHGQWPVNVEAADLHPSPRVDRVRRGLRSFVQAPQDVFEQAVREELTVADIVFLTHVLVASIPTGPQLARIFATSNEMGVTANPLAAPVTRPLVKAERPRPSSRADVVPPGNNHDVTASHRVPETFARLPVPHLPRHRGRSRSAPACRKGGGKGKGASVARPPRSMPYAT